MTKILTGIVDDHQLFSKSLALMLESFEHYEVVVEARNGKELQDKLAVLPAHRLPDILLIDVNMPVMDGVETAAWVHDHHPQIFLVALSQNDGDRTILAMIKAGCCAYLLKDTHPRELEKALGEIQSHGYYNGDVSNVNFRRLLEAEKNSLKLSMRELAFLRLAGSDKTYKEIAREMNLSERTIDGYREALFQKLHVQSRVGMVLEALKQDLIKL